MKLQAMAVTLSTLGICWAAMGIAVGQPADWGAPFSVEQSAAYRCLRAQGPITIDGKLDEEDWERAQKIKGFIVPPGGESDSPDVPRAKPAGSDTFAYLVWDDKFLYFGAELRDRDIYGEHPWSHDAPFGSDDIVELFVKPSRELPAYWEFHVTPTGATRDYFYARRGAGGDSRWMPYDSGMTAAVKLSGTLNNWEDKDQRWYVEVAIPWSAFARTGGKPASADYWTFLVARYDYSVHLDEGLELSVAAPLPTAAFHLHEFWPYIRFVE